MPAKVRRLGHSIGRWRHQIIAGEAGSRTGSSRKRRARDGRDQRPAAHGGQPIQALPYGTKAEKTLVRSAKSTPPLSTGLGAVEPWVEIQNGSNDAPIDARPS